MDLTKKRDPTADGDLDGPTTAFLKAWRKGSQHAFHFIRDLGGSGVRTWTTANTTDPMHAERALVARCPRVPLLLNAPLQWFPTFRLGRDPQDDFFHTPQKRRLTIESGSSRTLGNARKRHCRNTEELLNKRISYERKLSRETEIQSALCACGCFCPPCPESLRAGSS